MQGRCLLDHSRNIQSDQLVQLTQVEHPLTLVGFMVPVLLWVMQRGLLSAAILGRYQPLHQCQPWVRLEVLIRASSDLILPWHILAREWTEQRWREVMVEAGHFTLLAEGEHQALLDDPRYL